MRAYAESSKSFLEDVSRAREHVDAELGSLLLSQSPLPPAKGLEQLAYELINKILKCTMKIDVTAQLQLVQEKTSIETILPALSKKTFELNQTYPDTDIPLGVDNDELSVNSATKSQLKALNFV